MKTILIPLDGSKLAETALEPGLRLAERRGADVVLASVVSTLPPVPLGAPDADSVSRWVRMEEEGRRAYLQEVAERARADRPDLSIETRLTTASVSPALIRMTEDVDADLVTLTTHGHGAWQRWWLGSVADALLRGAGRPLLLLREGTESAELFSTASSPSHTLVPLDGSAASEDALDALAPLLPEEGGKVTLLRVLREPFPLASVYLPHAMEEATITEEHEREAKRGLRELARERIPEGVAVEVAVLISGDVPRAILAHAEKYGVDLLAFSTRGRGGVGRFLLGSVADKLIRGSRLPMLAVRRKR